jgi:putative glutamine amidotransferase
MNKKKNFRQLTLLLSLSLVFIIFACSDDRVRIGLSKGAGSPHYTQYASWLKMYNPKIDCIDLYSLDRNKAVEILKGCSGLVLTGGPDVHPDFFGKGFDTARCAIDMIRDTLEFALIKQAMKMNIPILAICRGEQIMNVAMGGSLIVDIPDDFGDMIIHRCKDHTTCFHDIEIMPGTMFEMICGVDSGVVNTNHHQAVDKLAEVFKIAACSHDGLIEAYEWIDPSGKPPLIAVQWHPERMDRSNPLSSHLAEHFLHEVMIYYQRKGQMGAGN